MTAHQKFLGKIISRISKTRPDDQFLYSARVHREIQRLERDCRRLKNRMLAGGGEPPANRY